jgi:hypothetical protein
MEGEKSISVEEWEDVVEGAGFASSMLMLLQLYSVQGRGMVKRRGNKLEWARFGIKK